MGSFSIWHWLIVGAVALLLFGGKGKISEIMGDVAKGIKSFKKGMAEENEAADAAPPSAPLRTLDHRAPNETAKVSDSHKLG
jgi:sec-independent protein translocase protein TatA